jgi:hypothetical protein
MVHTHEGNVEVPEREPGKDDADGFCMSDMCPGAPVVTLTVEELDMQKELPGDRVSCRQSQSL